MKFCKFFFISLSIAALASCSPKLKVETQSISVSSDPIGAAVYADGTLQGTTPTVVSLSKDREHIITVAKEGHGVHMIPIRLIKDEAKMVREAVLDGVHEGLIYQDPLTAVTSARGKFNEDEKTGKTARLEPASICLKLEQK